MLLYLPLFFLPFLLGGFYALQGGKGLPVDIVALRHDSGFNSVLPSPVIDRRKDSASKVEAYRMAELDSARLRTLRHLDPYLKRSADSVQPMEGGRVPARPEDVRAGQLLQELGRLQQSLRQPVLRKGVGEALYLPPKRESVRVAERPEAEPADPQLASLNGMLDKILRIQHPEEPGDGHVGAVGSAGAVSMEADSLSVKSLSAVVASDQVLVAGSTIGLRLEAEARVGRVVVSRGQMIYGVVSLSNDRMMVRINAIRVGAAIYPVSLQVYDLDALPGIHIPGDPGREVAKQSADQSLNGVNLLSLEPGLGAQAANAGLQAARNLLSRKVRTVRVAIRAGYQVLLRNERGGGSLRVVEMPRMDSAAGHDSVSTIPVCIDCEPFIYKRARDNGLGLVLRGIFLQAGRLYFLFRLDNEGPIDFKPAVVRWSIRDRHRARRTAVQDREIGALRAWVPPVIEGDSSRVLQFAFSPFALAKDKQLVIQVAEPDGARVVELAIHASVLSHVKFDDHAKEYSEAAQ